MDARAIGWARGVWDALRPYAIGSVYFPGFGEAEESLDGAPSAKAASASPRSAPSPIRTGCSRKRRSGHRSAAAEG
jgi:hypothetical protein